MLNAEVEYKYKYKGVCRERKRRNKNRRSHRRTESGPLYPKGWTLLVKSPGGGENEKSGSGDFFLIRRPRHLPHYFPFDIYEL